MAFDPNKLQRVKSQFNPEKLASIKKEEKGFSRRSAEAVIDSPILPVAGGVAGAIAGMGALVPAAGLGAGGEAIRQLAARSMGMKTPETSLEAAKDIGIEGITQAAGQAFGLGAGKVAGLATKIPLVKGAIKGTKKTIGDLFQLVTKLKPEDAATLFKNPKAILPGQMGKASKAWRAAADKAGIVIDDVSPEMIEILKGDGKAKVFDTYSRLISGETVTAKDAQIAKQALDSVVMPVAKTVRKNPQIATLQKIRSAFVERISKESPELAKANKQYGIAKSGEKFKSFFPRNTTGDPAYFRSSVLPALFTGAGASRGEPIEGMLQGAGVAAASSPLAIGALIALLGAGRGVGRFAGRTATASLAELAKSISQRE